MDEYLTINPNDLTIIRTYNDINSALYESIKLNESDPIHPIFYLYKKVDSNFVYMASLRRNFGSDNFYWHNIITDEVKKIEGRHE